MWRKHRQSDPKPRIFIISENYFCLQVNCGFCNFSSKLENSADETRSPFVFQLLGTMPSEKTISSVLSVSYKNLVETQEKADWQS